VVFAETELITLRAKSESLGAIAKGGMSIPDIAAGVHISAARRVQGLLGRIGIQSNLVFTGGVSNNPGMRRVLEDILGHAFTIPKFDLTFAGALGAAVYAAQGVAADTTDRVVPLGNVANRAHGEASAFEASRQAVLAELQAQIEQSQQEFIRRSDGRRRFGYQCNYTPLELLSASGARHIRLFRAGDPETVTRGERFTQSIYCDYTKSCLGYFSSGDALYGAIDGIYNFYTCNTIKRSSEVLDRFAPVKLLNLPKNRQESSSRAFFRTELEEMRRDLEKKTRTTIRNEDLHNQIVKYNRLRCVLHKISDLRKKRRPLLSGEEFLDIAKGYYYLEADHALPIFERIYDTLSARQDAEDAEDPPLRLMIAGSILADGDRKIHQILEKDFGAAVVTEDVCTGLRPFYHELPEDTDPLDALAEGYLDQAPCARMKPLWDAARFAARLAVEYKADGVLYTYLKFCPTHSVGLKEYVTAFQNAGVPALEISSDYSHSTEGQLRTRIEAFIEVLRDERNRHPLAVNQSG
jgi:benzoyl-CoA reductase/2-hydroxyglutaryl-CoA dehydratase subunit BcrC/BadD/HgdB